MKNSNSKRFSRSIVTHNTNEVLIEKNIFEFSSSKFTFNSKQPFESAKILYRNSPNSQNFTNALLCVHSTRNVSARKIINTPCFAVIGKEIVGFTHTIVCTVVKINFTTLI